MREKGEKIMDKTLIFKYLNGISSYNDRKVERSEVFNYTIDTVYTMDCGYETAIWKDDNDMIIVERYIDKEKAKKGHEKWCGFCEKNPKTVYSIQSHKREVL